jgi:hypothetical protein
VHSFTQIIIHPFNGTQIVIHRRGNRFRVFIDTDEDGAIEYSPEWIQFHMLKLFLISEAADRLIDKIGLTVCHYD